MQRLEQRILTSVPAISRPFQAYRSGEELILDLGLSDSWRVAAFDPHATVLPRLRAEFAAEKDPRPILWDQGSVYFDAFVNPDEAIAQGLLRFELSGQWLRGRFGLFKEKEKLWAFERVRTTQSLCPWPQSKVEWKEVDSYFRYLLSETKSFYRNRNLYALTAPQGALGNWQLNRFKGDVNLALELRVSLSRRGQNSHPDWIVLDFDPDLEDASFSKFKSVVSAANALCDELGLRRMWMLTGKRGMHLLIPILPQYEAAVISDLARILAEMIHEKVPHLSTITREPWLHRHRVLIDASLNIKGRASVGPFSPRAHLRPTVAMPIRFEQLLRARRLPSYNLEVLRFDEFKEAADLLIETTAHPNNAEVLFVSLEKLAYKVFNF